jgi:hypothetical protein
MSDSNNTPPARAGEQGILASLPHTRPQRPSARRSAARAKSAKGAPAARGRTKSAAGPPRAPAAKPPRAPAATKPPRAAPAAPPRAPIQGFESESEPRADGPVTPPSSAELAASVVELLGELAQSGFSSGGKLLREALGRLPGA